MGKRAPEYIYAKVIDTAKKKMFDVSKTMSEIAYEMGFSYPQYFARFLKRQVGNTPNKCRSRVG